MSEPVPRIASLDALKALLIVMVIAIHANVPETLTDPQLREWVGLITSTIAVPGFFWIDGFIFGAKLGDSVKVGVAKTIVTGWRRLLLPWLIFSIVYTAMRVLLAASGIGQSPIDSDTQPAIAAFANAVWYSQSAAQLYFLPTLLLVRIAASAMANSLATLDARIILGVAIGLGHLFHVYIGPWYEATVRPPGEDPLQHVLWGLGFFLLGIACRRLQFTRLTSSTLGAIAIGGLGLAWLAQSSPAGWYYFQLSYLLVATWTVLRIRHFSPLLLAVGRRTMGIYLLHAPLILVASRRWWLESAQMTDLPAYILTIATTLGFSLVATLIIERIGWGGWLLGQFGNSGIRRAGKKV
ncbi:MAG: acyltransferase [Steroidobacteraceae bacterium]